MRVSNRLVSFWALAMYTVLTVCGQPVHLRLCSLQPATGASPSQTACCPGHCSAARDYVGESGASDVEGRDPVRDRRPHDSRNCAVCQFLVKTPTLAVAAEVSSLQPLADRLTLPAAPSLVPEFRSAFFSRGPPHA
jgi:hypothetical protein